VKIVAVPCLKDNYAYLVIDGGGMAAVVDASEAGPVRDAVVREGVKVQMILSTHHHWDHVGGNEELASELQVPVVGHASDRGRLPGLSRGVEDGATVRFGDLEARCIHVPGHTLGAVAYYFDSPSGRAVFTGDTLFSAGCGRLFEGTPAQMSASLARLGALPPDARVYCGHEYTEQNLRFAEAVEGGDAVSQARERATRLRAAGQPTVGTTVGDELRTNPFLRVESPEIRRHLAIAPDADAVAAFAAIRSAKDRFH
jgi:hydroxyacylglutathione hydrolase